MKKFFQTKYFVIFLVLLAVMIPTVIFASITGDYFKSNSASNLGVVSKHGEATVVNRSDKDIFIPNKSTPEWGSFEKNTPQYVSIAVCGDSVCSDGENSTNCVVDCPAPKGYCGDGICSQGTLVEVPYNPPREIEKYVEVCTYHQSGWMYVPFVNVIVWATGNAHYSTCDNVNKKFLVYSGWEPRGEVWQANDPNTQTTCKDDCAPPSGSGCGVCGYDSGGSLCPNYCSNRGYNLVNCSYHSATTVNSSVPNLVLKNNPINNVAIKKYFTASEALASASLTTQTYTYETPAGYDCNFTGSGTSNLCAAGTYCPVTGGLKPGTSYTSWLTYSSNSSSDYYPSNVQKTCTPGHFCPIGSHFQRICPVNTYSGSGADKCTACPAGTITAVPGMSSVDFCTPFQISQDTVCQGDGTTGENPANSPYDCPDASQAGNLWKGDGRCTGAEDAINSPKDCACGNGYCDNGETYLSCMPDCYGLDSVCGTTAKINGVWTTYKETKYTKYYNNSVLNKSDCQYMDPSATCGDGICSASEGYNAGLNPPRIVCKLDCHCGDGYCDSSIGETYSSCNADCKCGDGVCNNGEDRYSCIQDCHCGNGQCEMSYGENNINCSSDCRCGDNVCSAGENSTCAHDCFACNYDHICDSGENTSCTDCGHVIKDPYSLEY